MKFTKTSLTGFLMLGSLLFPQALSAQSLFAQEGPSVNRQARNLGMGNVGIALPGSHDSSPFYNPAGLNDLEKGRFKFLSPTFEVSHGSIGLMSDLFSLADDVNVDPTSARVQALSDFINAHTGQFERVRFTFDLFSYARKNFAAGVLIDERLDNAFRDPTLPAFAMRQEGDLVVYFSGGYGFWDKLLQMGISFRPTFRFAMDEQDQVIGFDDVVTNNADGEPILIDQFKRVKDERFGLGVDVGVKTNLAFPVLKDMGFYKYLKPEAGLAWYDIGSPSYGGAAGSRQSIGIGLAIHPDIWKLKNTVSLDFRDLNRDRAFISMLHFGVEVQTPFRLGFRAGVNQGYPTGGLTIDLWYFKLEGAVYYEEVAAKSYSDGDFRFIVSFNFGV